MDNNSAHLSSRQDEPRHSRDGRHEERINTTSRYLLYSGLLLLIFVACAAFWGVSRKTALVFSIDSTRAIEQSSKTFTFVWTLSGTILAFTTGTLFNQLLKISIQQNVAAYGLKIGLIEFSSRLYARKWLNDHRPGRLLLSVFTIVFAIAFGLLVSAYTGLLTPTKVYVESNVYGSELDITSAAFSKWFSESGENFIEACGQSKTYGSGSSAVTLPSCPQVKDPVPLVYTDGFVSAGLASIEAKYAHYNPTTSVLGLSFNGTTKGVLPRGFNTIKYFNTFPKAELPPVANYNYSVIQQGISVNVSCLDVGLKSNVIWKTQGEYLFDQTNGNAQESVYLQNFTYPVNDDTNLLVAGKNMISAFNYFYGDNFENARLDIASYGSYAADWKLPNLTCTIEPYLTTVNTSFSNTTGLFTATVVAIPSYKLLYNLATVNDWLFRVFSVSTGNQIINSIIALQNTPSYDTGVFSNVTINWPSSIELLVQGMTEYYATRIRMLIEAEINSTHVEPSGFRPIQATISSWRLGYNGASAAVIILFPLMGFVLLCSAVVIALGVRTGIGHVTKFDPTNTTHIIIASALGGKNGSLDGLRGEHAIHADDKALNLRVNYRDDIQSFQEVQYESPRGYTELSNLPPSDEVPPSKHGLFVRKPFVRTTTG